MSQTGSFERSSGGKVPDVRTLTGNVGNTVRPDSSGDIKVVGTGIVTVEGDASTHSLTISSSAAKDSTTSQKGIVQLSTDAESIAGTNSTKAVVPSSLKAKLGDQTDHAILIAKGSNKKFEYETLNDGELLMGATGKDPKGGSLVSSNATILFTTGENSLNLKVGDRVPTSVGVDGGDSAIPTGNQFKIRGGANVSTTASGDTVQIDVVSPGTQDATTTKKGVVRLSTDDESKLGIATGAIAVTPTSLKYKLGDQTTHGIAYGKGTGEKVQWTTGLSDGQIVIGDTDGTPKAANVTSSNNTIAITKGSNTLDLKASTAIPIRVATENGVAVPRNNQLTISGGKGISTSAIGENVIVKIGNSVPNTFTGDAGSGAVPVGSILQVKGGTNCSTLATGNTITINATGGGGGGGGGGGSELTVDTDGSAATSSSHVLKVKGANSLIQTSGSSNEVRLTAASSIVSNVITDAGNATINNNSLEIAGSTHIETEIDSTKSNRVVINADEKLVSTIRASDGHTIHGVNFGVNVTGGIDCNTRKGVGANDLIVDMTGGNRSLEFGDTKSPEGIAKPVSNKIEMHGDTGVDITASGNRVRFAAKDNIPTVITADRGTATPSNNSFKIAGGSNVSTSASGNTVTITSTGGGGSSNLEFVDTDGKIARPVSNQIEMVGDSTMSVKAGIPDSNAIYFKIKGGVPTQFETDQGTAYATDTGELQILGGSNIITTASGNRITITSSGGGSSNPLTIFTFTDDQPRGNVPVNSSNQILYSGFHGIVCAKSSDTPAGRPEWKGHGVDFYLGCLHEMVTATDLVTPSADHRESFGTIHLGNTPANEGMAVQLPAVHVGYEMSFVSINSTYPGFEVFPPGGGKIWIGDQSTSVAPASGALGVARVRSTKRGDVLRLICIVENKEWQALGTIGTFTLM